MINPKVNIYKFLLLNRLIVFALVGAFLVASIIMGISINRLYSKQLNTVLVVGTEGEVIPMKWLKRKENIEIELKHHLLMFHENFYAYDLMNVKRNTEKALWLGDNSIEQLYIKRSNDGWYNKVEMYNIKQSIVIEPENIIIQGNKEPFQFKIIAELTITQGNQISIYQFETLGNIIFVSRNYPLNPHGFLITNFSEINRMQLK